MPTGSPATVNRPLRSLVVVRRPPVVRLSTSTEAPTSGPPACATTVPWRSPVAACARATRGAAMIASAIPAIARTPALREAATIIFVAMAVIVPFAALRPMSSSAARVAAVPYDVVTTEEARALAAREPLSFLHVSRAEVDLPPGTNPYADEVYAKAVTNMEGLKRKALLQDD